MSVDFAARKEISMKVVMPKIGMAMQEAMIIKWYRNDGERLVAGEPMVYIETEKITSVIPSPTTGIFRKLANEGEIVACNIEIAEIIAE